MDEALRMIEAGLGRVPTGAGREPFKQYNNAPSAASSCREAGLIEAVLYRLQTGYYADLIEEAAAL